MKRNEGEECGHHPWQYSSEEVRSSMTFFVPQNGQFEKKKTRAAYVMVHGKSWFVGSGGKMPPPIFECAFS